MRPDKKSKNRQLSKADDEDFERISRRELGRMATGNWDAMMAFWEMLPRAWPSTRRRLLFHCLELCGQRRDPPPLRLITCLRRELAKSPRGRVHDRGKMEEAAQYLVDHPKSSFSKIASAIGIDPANKTVVRDYTRRPQFWREVQDRLVRSGQKSGDEAELRRRLLVQTKIV